MKISILHIIRRSLLFYKRAVIYQILIVVILSAVITGSLLTGYSVRQSLKITAAGKLGNTGLLISSGARYFDASLSERMSRLTGERAISIIEMNGYCQSFTTGVTALNTNIYGIDPDFFSFQGNDTLFIEPGTAAINEKLARNLGIVKGDEIIIRFREISPISSDMPFAPSKESKGSLVLTVEKILSSGESGNFSLGISQIVPMNIFINLSDLSMNTTDVAKRNRLLIENTKNLSPSALKEILKGSLSPNDLGLIIRNAERSDEPELVSERIFIDQEIIDAITKVIPSSGPVITYLANNIICGSKSTPYSFISALPSTLYSGTPKGDHIIINRWLADDLNASVNDTITLKWFTPGSFGKLEERGKTFIINRIVEMINIWSDPSLMPDFPGISNRVTCSDWDAGVPLKMDLIRKKDEAYWNNFKGTPKAFIEYETGKELWGNNFGPATAIRFPGTFIEKEILNKLNGSFDPDKTGFTVTNPGIEATNAANESVDFSTLFLSLGIFIIFSCIILLSLAISAFSDSRKEQAATFFALGFTNKWIGKLFFLETLTIVLTGTFPGIFAGLLVNIIIISALNSVWTGAVQTNTIAGYFSIIPLILGFFITVFISLVLVIIKTKNFLKSLNEKDTGFYPGHSQKRNFYLLLLSFSAALILMTLSFLRSDNAVLLSFSGGVAIFVSMVLFWRQVIIRRDRGIIFRPGALSRRFYSFNPSLALTPVIFIAAGIFAVFITGSNRMEISDKMLLPSGGTGGFLLWGETAIPVREDLRTLSGRGEFGLNEDQFSDMRFMPAKLLSGDDASCLNLNHVSSPPLLGLDPSVFIGKGSFSFASEMKGIKETNPWKIINEPGDKNIIFGIADQTVLEWGLKIKPGDTLKLKAENGQPLNIIIAAGLKSSLFQGFILIGENNFNRFFPSVSGFSVFLIDGKKELADDYYIAIKERFRNYGVSTVPARERLASFFEVTNTYLSVFTILGSFGILIGIFGLGFILIRNYNQRKSEFALLLAMGFPVRKIRRLILSEQIFILIAGLLTGVSSAILATLPSIRNGAEIPWIFLIIMMILVFTAGLTASILSVKTVKNEALIKILRME
jgi:ABC-type lipoprotein release transport system permease subunit